jgi:hypothetical protein
MASGEGIFTMRVMSIVLIALTLSSCSVGMAMSGKPNPNLGAVRTGATRGEVELHLGAPVRSTTLPDGSRLDVYEYEIGNEPSGGRAVGHAVMDILTLGIWEIVGTPIEGVQGDKFELSVSYDKDDTVMSITSQKVAS